MQTWEVAKERIINITKEDEEFAKFYFDMVEEIVKRRKELGVSMAFLAFKLQLDLSTVKQFENYRAVVKITTLYKMVKMLGGRIIIEEGEGKIGN